MISIEEINLLKGQNEALLKQNKDLQKQVLNLKAENDFLKKELEYSIKLRKQIQNDLLKSDRLNDNLEAKNTELKAENERLKSCLQEIKAIVCSNYEIIDTQGRKNILKLITKAEEEWK